jgi:hypothetical protein
MTIDDQKEQFSFAYARAVAAVAKVAVSLTFARNAGFQIFSDASN